LYAGCAAGALGARLRGEYRGENFGDAPSRAKAAPSKAEQGRRTWLLDGSGPIAAVTEKELRTIMRAIPLLYQIASPLIVVFVLTSVNRNVAAGKPHLPLGLMLCLAYAIVGFTTLIYNNLGTEGAGIQLLFLSPTPIRTVMLAKNLFHAALLAVVVVLVGIVACWRLGTPPLDAIAASAAWVLFAVPLHLAAGNAFSIVLGYKMNVGRMGRQKGSQSNALLSLAVQAATLGVGALVFALCAWSHRLWLAGPVFLVLAAVSVFAWMRVLASVDRMANARREDLIETLVKAE
jgi:ABC-2 type transport system permease protein